MKIRKKWQRFLAALLAVVMLAGNFAVTVPTMESYASTVLATKNLWKGGGAMLYQKYRKYLYRLRVPSDNKDVFCLNQFAHMFTGHVVDGKPYDISEFPDVVFSKEDFEKLALICHWYEEEGAQNDLRYVAAQISIWALINRTWDVNGAETDLAASHLTVNPSAFKAAVWEVRQYVEDNCTDPAFSSGKRKLPYWCSTHSEMASVQNMEIIDGIYQVNFDISKLPELGKMDWKLPDENWEKRLSPGTLTFTYSGAGEPSGTISGKMPPSMRNVVPNSTNLTIYIPDLAQDQPMVSGGIIPSYLYINIGSGGAVPPGAPGEPGSSVEIYRHTETFEANYHIDLEKFCAETGLTLEGSTFQVLEAFDRSQLGDGMDGSVSEEFMSPGIWSGWKMCREITTDENGYASHSDHKEYEYSKTYCGGHPEPEYMDVPEVGEGDEDAAAEAEAIAAENERRRAEWEAMCQLCEQETDFHSETPGEALSMMLSDRDETYETFVNLEYQYTVKEVQARPGYILHGLHNDDAVIEVISTNASEGGADAWEANRTMNAAVANTITEAVMRKNLKPLWNPGSLTFSLPEFHVMELEEIRTVEEEKEQEIASPANAEEEKENQAGPGVQEPEIASPVNAREEKEDKTEPDIQEKPEQPEIASPANAMEVEEKPEKTEIEEGLEASEEQETERSQIASPPNAEEAPDDKNDETDEPDEDLPQDGELVNDLVSIDSSLEDLSEDFRSAYILHDRKLLEGISYGIAPAADSPGDDEGISVSVSLPEPVEDDEAWAEPGESDLLSYTFQIYDHRTEGEVHINKRDLELYRENQAESYGKAQGDATLEGAVYGLYAAADIIHPDGKTGMVFKAGDLVSIATTDAKGDAVFKAITEISEASAAADNKDHTWIGHPLILGSYYLQELSRSEGYELSVTGINLTESNRTGTGTVTLSQAGNVENTALGSEPDNNDGSWNEFSVTNFKTEDGYDVVLSGYPKDTEIYRHSQIEKEVTEEIITGSSYEPKKDDSGNIIYQTAEGGEYKLDADGNYIQIPDQYSDRPIYRTYTARYRLNNYPSGTATPEDPDKWNDKQTADASYVEQEANSMLGQIGYKEIPNPASVPGTVIDLTGTTNQELVTEILDWFALNDFWDSGFVERVYSEGGQWKALIRHDYQVYKNAYAIYDTKHDELYVRKNLTFADGNDGHEFLKYGNGEFGISGSVVRVPDQEITGSPAVGEDLASYIQTKYQPLYETYQPGEVLLDSEGNPIPEMELVYTYGEVTETIVEDVFVEIETEYDEETGEYRFHMAEKAMDQPITMDFRAVTKETFIESDGQTMRYNDYLIKKAGASVTAYAPLKEQEEGSYVKQVQLLYPGQLQVFQDNGTRKAPVQVLERVIKQSIKVTKDIAKDSYDKHNTYRPHKDPFTVLFGGYHGEGKKFVPGFHFKAYLVSDLINAGLLEAKEDGSWDYKKLFLDETKRKEFDAFAIEWDSPDRDTDGDLTTLYANEGNGAEPYYGRSMMLPYGTYVVVEQVPKELVNKHYQIDEPKEVELPFVPEILPDGTVHEDVPSPEYLYWEDMSLEEMSKKYLIRFGEENHVIKAHNHDGDFEVYKYGLDKDLHREDVTYYGRSTSENAGTADQVYYQWLYDRDGNVIDYGVTRDNVPTMTGKTTAVNGKFAKAFVPWSVVDPRYGEVIDDEGNVGNRVPGRDPDGSFNYVAFAKTHLENTWYSSRLRIEKVDEETGENIIHDGALFRIYLASRDVKGDGSSSVTGTGNVTYVTKTVTGTRAELEARGDVDDITWNEGAKTFTGTVTEPDYSQMELVTMVDMEGQETGIFKAFSTEQEVQKEDGTISKEKVGYIETYEPLGAGTYVLVEIQAPKGYQKSKPIAVEVYRDQVTYYEGGEPENRTVADRYQYVVPLTATEETVYEDVAQITVKDSPSKMMIHKVESGDRRIGDENGLDGLTNVNDQGDLLTYIIRGRKEYLEARGDVEGITWDEEKKEYYGTVTKSYQEWSENLIAGTEKELLGQKNVKVLYDVDTGAFSGFGIRYEIPVKEAELTLYEGLKVEKLSDGYGGIVVSYEEGKVSSIKAYETGNHLEITTNEKDTKPLYLNIWDAESIDNEPIDVVFYDLETVDTQRDRETGELWVLDDRGNRICMADPSTGMAYTYDDYGNLIVYAADESGNKKVAQSIEIHEDGTTESIYVDLDVKEDEVGLPLYYKEGKVTYKEEVWITDGTVHEISRLPFGAYILEETKVPYDQGYIQSPAMGLILRESKEEQHYYFQNDFTKTNLAKIDATTKEEIPDAGMTLYQAQRIPDESDKGYHLEKTEVYAEWISGYQYDDNGKLLLIKGDEKVSTREPHWIDHIPVGDYILEETRVPYEWGYVQSDPVEILVKETGEVQTFVMEDDYTSIEIKKYDEKTGEVLDDDHKATLSLYKAVLDENGDPVIKTTKEIPGTEIPVYDPASKIVTWQTSSGKEVLATGRIVTDEYGVTKTVYDYDVVSIDPTPEIKGARYYITETGSTRFDYLPVGHYVLVEEETPKGYATALPKLIIVEEMGHLQKVQQFEMADVPLTLEVSKTDTSGGAGQVKDARMAIYPVVDGEKAETPAYTWISGSDGTYTEEDEKKGLIPLGLTVGDVRLHRIQYIPAGDYVLVEESASYGFLKAEEIFFTVMDTGEVQGVEMVDEIPEGVLTIGKHDIDQMDTLLSGATFILTNKDTGELIETLTTGTDGTATANSVPIGCMVNGVFAAYTYVVEEISAPDNYMLNTGKYEFQFTYKDDATAKIPLTYDAVDKQNQAKIAKKDMGGNRLSGARLKVVSKADDQMVIDQWTSSEQDYYITGIPVGEYTLIEVETPGKGYALAEPMDFSVMPNMTEPVYVEMVDFSSRVEIEKVSAGTEKLLSGAKLQLYKKGNPEIGEENVLLREWTSSAEKSEVFYGLEPGTYVIHEVSAPAGYKLGEDLEITVEDISDIQVFRYENRKKPGGDGGNTPDPSPEEISFLKVSDQGAYLSGAEFTFYRLDGSVLTTAVSDRQGRITILKPDPGTYTFRETKAPKGYMVSDQVYQFIVHQNGTVIGDYKVVNEPVVRKMGIVTAFYGSRLQGGTKAHVGNWEPPKTGDDRISMWWYLAGTYLPLAGIVALLAAGSKKKGKWLFLFIIAGACMLGTVTEAYGSQAEKADTERTEEQLEVCIEGQREEQPERQSEEQPEKQPERQSVSSHVAEQIYETTDKLQCESAYGETLFPSLLERNGITFRRQQVMMEIVEERPEEEAVLYYQFPAFTDAAENHRPRQVLEQNGKIYQLYDYQVLETKIPEKTVYVQETIPYEGVELIDTIPQLGEIQVVDEQTGESREEHLPLEEVRRGEYYWSDQFQFPVVVEHYDADTYMIGENQVPAADDLYQYQEMILELLNLDSEYYRIDRIQWVSEPYISQDRWLRDAVAYGEKLVYDAEAVYAGMVTWEEKRGHSVSARYLDSSIKDPFIYKVKATALYEETEKPEESEEPSFLEKVWAVVQEYAVILSLGLLLLLWLLAALYRWRKAWKEEKH